MPSNKKINPKLLFLGAFGFLLIATNITVFLETPRWTEKYITAFILGNLCMFIAAAYMYFVFKAFKQVPLLTEEKQVQYFKKSLLILGLTVLIVPFFLVISVPDSAHDWDFFVIFRNTSDLRGKTFDHLPMTQDQQRYFLRYGNNQFFGMISNFLFAPFDMAVKIWVQTGISAVLTSISVLAGSFTVKKIASLKEALLYNIVAFGFLPFYVYGAQFYTDTVSLPFVILGLLFMIYALKSDSLAKELAWWAIAALVIFFGYYIKPTVAIPVIAMIIFLLLNKKWKKLIIMLPIFAFLFFGVHETVKRTVATDPAFSAENNERYNLPLMHWVTMSFAPNNRWGGFNQEVLTYSESFPDYESKKVADRELFISNLKEQGFSGFMLQIWRKISYTWFNGDLSGFFYTYRHQNPFIFRYFDWTSFNSNEGNVTGWILLKAAQTLYWIAIVPLMFYEIWLSLWKKRKTEWFIVGLSMFGLTGFLLIWEANSRYLYNFAPIILALATMGLLDLLKALALRKQGDVDGLTK